MMYVHMVRIIWVNLRLYYGQHCIEYRDCSWVGIIDFAVHSLLMKNSGT